MASNLKLTTFMKWNMTSEKEQNIKKRIYSDKTQKTFFISPFNIDLIALNKKNYTLINLNFINDDKDSDVLKHKKSCNSGSINHENNHKKLSL